MNKKKNTKKNKFTARHQASISEANAKKKKRSGKNLMTHNNPLLDCYFKDVNTFEVLSRKEEEKLFEQYLKWKTNPKAGQSTRARGREAYDKLIGSNLRLVIKIANQYNYCSMSLEDLINEGNVGLMTAVDKFDPARKVKLSTYASYWIRQSIHRALEKQSRTIRLPSYTYPLLKKINKFINEYRDEHGSQPSVDEIVKETKVPRDSVVNLFSSGVANMVSLDAPIATADTEQSEATLQDVTQDFNTAPPSTTAEKDDDAEIIHDFLSKLSRRERYIIMRRFGMDGFDLETLDKIGERYGISRERIRQIQMVAMRKLRKFSIDTYDKTWADFAG